MTHGHVTRAFLASIAEACRHHGVTRGTVRGKAMGNQIALEFRGDFPASVPAAAPQRVGHVRMGRGPISRRRD